MKHEIEMKFRASDPAALRRAVLRAGGRYVGTVLQTDCYFDTPKLSLLRRDRGLRLRTGRHLAGRDGGQKVLSAMVTYKGPRHAAGRVKKRREIQTPVGDPRAVSDMLEALGLTRRLIIQKRRSTWRLARCLVELDELPVLGTFVEIEGESARAVRSVARKLGLDGPPLKDHYVQLVTRACGRVGRKCLEVTFARCGRACRNKAFPRDPAIM